MEETKPLFAESYKVVIWEHELWGPTAWVQVLVVAPIIYTSLDLLFVPQFPMWKTGLIVLIWGLN